MMMMMVMMKSRLFHVAALVIVLNYVCAGTRGYHMADSTASCYASRKAMTHVLKLYRQMQ